jgi:hypothetical protein
LEKFPVFTGVLALHARDAAGHPARSYFAMLGFCTLRFFMREPGRGRTGMSLTNRAYACRHAGVTAVQHLCQQVETKSFFMQQEWMG